MLPLPQAERTVTVGLSIVKLGVLKHLLHVLQSTSLLLEPSWCHRALSLILVNPS